MSDKAPKKINGATFRKDKTGLTTIVQPWEVFTLEECDTFAPDPSPRGLPLVDRSADEFVVGTWTLKLTYEGVTPNAPDSITFENSSALEVELDTSMAGDPIQSHPNFPAINAKYGWNATKKEFPETLQPQGSSASALSGAKGQPQRNPLHGVDSYLAVGAVFRVTFTARNAPNDVLDGIGTVVSRPPGWNLLGIPHPTGRNWLKLAPKIGVRGNASRIASEWMLSGPNGWITDIYGRSQLFGKKS